MFWYKEEKIEFKSILIKSGVVNKNGDDFSNIDWYFAKIPAKTQYYIQELVPKMEQAFRKRFKLDEAQEFVSNLRKMTRLGIKSIEVSEDMMYALKDYFDINCNHIGDYERFSDFETPMYIFGIEIKEEKRY